jgi:hypothetical protein
VVAQTHETESVNVRAGATGTSMVITKTTEASDLTTAVANASDASSDLDAADVAVAAATTNVKAMFTEFMAQITTRIRAATVSEKSFETLLSRANDAAMWMSCCAEPDSNDAWRDLRSRLLSPRPDAAWTEEDPAMAPRLDQARAMAEFAQCEDGPQILENLCNHYGEQRGRDTEDLAVLAEWPPGLAATKVRYDAAVAQVGTLDADLAAMAGGADSVSRGEAHCRGLEAAFIGVYSGVSTSTDYRDARAQADLLATISDLQFQVADRRVRMADVMTISCEEPAREVEANQSTEEDGALVPPSPEGWEIDERAARQEIVLLMRDLLNYKASERRLVAQMWASAPQPGESLLDMIWSAVTLSVDPSAVFELTGQVSELWEGWIARIRTLREAYVRAGVPSDEWMVTSAPGDKRNLDYEPDIEDVVDVNEAVTDSPTDHEASAASLRRRFGSY